MHDLLRDMAIWITSPSFSSSCFSFSKFLVKAGQGLEQPPEEKFWEGMGRISLMRNKIRDLRIVPNCPVLMSLLLGHNELGKIHDNFFCFMPKLQFLDLSSTKIKSLPSSLSLLVNLRVLVARYCEELHDMPPLGDLKELQLLDLGWTAINNLPQGIESLENLKCLDLISTHVLDISCNVMSRLTTLEELELYGQKQMMSVDNWRGVATLQRLVSLKIILPSLDVFPADDLNHPVWSRLRRFEVRFGFGAPMLHLHNPLSSFEREISICNCQYFPSHFKGLMRNVESLSVGNCLGLETASQIFSDSKSLKSVVLNHVEDVKCFIDWRHVRGNNVLCCPENLHLQFLPSLHKVFDGGLPIGNQQLRYVDIRDCPRLTSIFSANMLQHLPQLEFLAVSGCKEIEKIIEGDLLSVAAFQSLRSLLLLDLPKIKTIWNQRLVLTSMKHIMVSNCPELKKLPGLCSRIKQITGMIRGGKEWWEGLE